MAMDWFRSWHNAPTDPKWLLIARRANVPPGMVSAVFWALLDYASQEKERGSIDGFDVETYAGWAGWDEDQVQSILDAMRSKGVITTDNRLASWEKRQVKREDEGTAARVAKHRASKASVTNADTAQDVTVTQSNARKRSVTRSNHRLDSDKTRLEETRNASSVTKESNHHSANGAAADALIDPELAQALARWKETFAETPWEANPPIALLPKWLAYYGPDVLCYMIGKAKDKDNPGGWLYTTYDNWRKDGEVAPYVLKAVNEAKLAAAPVTKRTLKVDFGDGIAQDVEVQARG